MDTRTKLVLEFDVRGAGRGTGEANKMAAAVNNVADAWDDMADAYDEMPDPPADMFDDFIDDVHEAEEAVEDLTAAQKKARAEQDKINKAFDEAAKDAHKAAQATDELTRARKEAAKFKPQEKGPPTSQAERNQIKIADLTEGAQKQQRAQISGLQEQEALELRLASAQDEALNAGRVELGVAQSRLNIETQLAAQADGLLSAQRQALQVGQKREALAVELAVSSDADMRDARLLLDIERERVTNDAKLSAARDGEIAAQRQEIGLEQRRLAMGVEASALLDDDLRNEQRLLVLERERLAVEVQLSAQADAQLVAQRGVVAVGKTREQLATELAVLSDGDLRDTKILLSVEQERIQNAAKLDASRDAGIAAQRVSVAVDQERVALNAKISASADESVRVGRSLVAQQQAALATDIKLLQIKSQANQELALESAKQRDIAANKAVIANNANQEAKAARLKASLIQTEQRVQTQNVAMQQERLRGLLIEEATLKESLAIEGKMKILGDEQLQDKSKELALTQRLNSLQVELAELQRDDIQAARAEVAFQRERLEIIDAIAEIEKGGSDEEFSKLKEKLRLLEQERDLKNEIQEQGRFVGEGDLRDQNEKLNALQQEKALIADLEAQGRIAKGGDLELMQNKLNAMEQETKLLADIAEAKRASVGGDLRAIQDQKILADVTQDHADEQVRLNHILNNPAALQRARDLHAMEEQLERSTRTWREKVEFVADILEKTDSSLQVWFTLGMVAETAFKVFTEGTIARGIQDATAALGQFNAEVQISAGAEGLMTRTQARQAALRGAEMGLGKGAQGQLAGFAGTLGQRAVALGDSADVGEATVEALRGLQQELKSGELGQNFQDLGVSVAQYDRAVRMAAADSGVLPDALDLQTKRQLLLAQATNDSTAALEIYGNEQLRNAAGAKTAFVEFREALGASLAGGNMLDRVGVTVQQAKIADAQKQLDMAMSKLDHANRTTQGGNIFESGDEKDRKHRAAAQSSVDYAERALFEAQNTQNLQESAVLTKQINEQLELRTDTMLLLGEEGAAELLQLNKIFQMEREKHDLWGGDTEIMDELNAAIDEQVASSSLINQQTIEYIRQKMTLADLEKVISEQQAIQLPAQVKIAEARAKAAKHRLDSATVMSFGDRQHEASLIAQKDLELAILKEMERKGATLEEATEYMQSDKIAMLLKLESERAITDESLKHGRLLTAQRKEQLEIKQVVNDLKQDALKITESAEHYNMAIGRAVAVKVFDDSSVAAKKLLTALAGGEDKVFGMVKWAGDLATTFNNLSGNRLFSDGFLEKIFAPKDGDGKDPTGAGKKDKTGGGKKDDDMLERLRRERIEREIADRARLGFVKAEDFEFNGEIIREERKLYQEQADFIRDNLTAVSTYYETTHGEMGDIDQIMRGELARLEWQYADEVKQADGRAAELAAVDQAFMARIDELHKQMVERNSTFFTSLEEGLGRYASTAQVKLAEASAAWQAHVKEYEVMQQLVADAQKDINARALDNMVVDEVTTSGPQRKLSDGEKGAVNARAEAAAQMKEVLSAHQWSADQKLVIEANYQAKLYEIEQSYNQARFDENQRIRDEMAASAQAALAETQELMSHFSDQARSMSESGQATFQGGLSSIGMKAAEGLDGMMAGMIGYIGVLGEVDKAQTRLAMSEEQMTKANTNSAAIYAKSVGGILGAAGKAADGVIKNERWKAGIKGGVHVAESIGAFAEGNIVGGTMHALAAAKFFVIAGTASEAPAKAKKAEATKRTALSQNTVALSRDRGMTAWTQVFIQLHPITGEAMVSTMNDSARRGNMTGRGIDSRLTRPTATVRTEV